MEIVSGTFKKTIMTEYDRSHFFMMLTLFNSFFINKIAMKTAQDLHNTHTHLVSDINFLRDEIHFFKTVINERSLTTKSPFQQEKLENYLEEITQLAAVLDELEMNSKSVEVKVKKLLEAGTITMEEPVFQSVKGISEEYEGQYLKLKGLKKALFNLN